MEINSSVNLVFPARIVGRLATIWAYHKPISATVFRSNYRVIAAAKTELFKGPNLKERLQYAAENGPVLGKMVLLDVAERDSSEYGSENIGPAFIAELNRLTQIVYASETGFETLPLETAFAQSIITEDERDEVESKAVFFTCGYAMSPSSGKAWIAWTLARSMVGSITSSLPTEFAASLKTSTPPATSEATTT